MSLNQIASLGQNELNMLCRHTPFFLALVASAPLVFNSVDIMDQSYKSILAKFLPLFPVWSTRVTYKPVRMIMTFYLIHIAESLFDLKKKRKWNLHQDMQSTLDDTLI